jgi:dihydroorotate dehydrogenase (NAD+) catalytic subunit
VADLRTIIKGLQLKSPVLPGPGLNVAGAVAAIAAVQGGAAALVMQTVTMAPGTRANTTAFPYGKDGLFHRQPCSSVPFEAWFVSEFTPALQAARAAGVPCIPSIGYREAEVRYIGARLAAAGADALFYDTHDASRDEILPALRGLKADVTIPVIVRLSPHHGEDLADLALLLEPYADAFCVIGSFGPNLLLDIEQGAPALDSPLGIGYLSGAPIRPIAQRFVFQLAKQVTKPIIAAGGAMTGKDVVEFMMLGAAAVMLSTHAMAKGENVYGQIATELNEWLDGHGYSHANAVHRAYLRKYGHGQRVVIEKEEAPVLIEENCIKCTFCETVCFYDAIIAPPKMLPTINNDPCFECGLCVSACPTDALTFRRRDQLTRLSPEGA